MKKKMVTGYRKILEKKMKKKIKLNGKSNLKSKN